MKRFATSFALLVFLPVLMCTETGLAQQYPLEVTTQVLTPWSPLLADWEAHPERIQVTVRNTDLNQRYEFRLSGTLENDAGGLQIRTRQDQSMRMFTIEAGGIMMLNGYDYTIFNQDQVEGHGALRDEVARTGRLPEGNYTICAQALDYDTKAPLSSPAPAGCQTIQIQYGEVPQLITPPCGDPVQLPQPQIVQFQWSTPVAGIPPEAMASLRYELIIVPVLNGKTPETAIESPGEFPFFIQRDLTSTVYQYTAADPALEPGRWYAWRVRAYDLNNRLAFRNEGESEVCSFLCQTLDADCFTMAPFSPADGASISGGLPRFTLELDHGIHQEAITGGRLRIWKIAQRLSKANWQSIQAEAVLDVAFTGNGTSQVLMREWRDRHLCELRFVNYPGSEVTFAPDFWGRYSWECTLAYDATTVRNDGTGCISPSVTSMRGRFTNKTKEGTLIASCESSCIAEIPDNRIDASPQFSTGDTITIGKFQLLLSEMSHINGGLQGRGFVSVPFLNEIRVPVTFTGLTVNSSGQVIQGKAESVPPETSSTESTADFAQRMQELCATPTRWTSQLYGKEVEFPIGFDNVTYGKRNIIAVTGMTFDVTRAELRMSYVEDISTWLPYADAKLVYAGTCCMHTDGFDNGNVSAPLIETKEFSSNSTIGYTLNKEENSVVLNCNGLQGYHVDIHARFPRSWLLPVSSTGEIDAKAQSRVTARIQTTVENLSDWIAKAEFPCDIVATDLPGMKFSADKIVFDASSTNDPENAMYPSWISSSGGKAGRRGFVSTFCKATHELIRRPNGKGVMIPVNGLFISKNGLSAEIDQEAVVGKVTGAQIGGWLTTIEDAHLKIRNNSVVKSTFNGSLRVPISTEPIPYSCSLQSLYKASHKTSYQGRLTSRDIPASLWHARMTVQKNASINFRKQASGNFSATLLIHGTMDLRSGESSIPLIRIPGLRFQDFEIIQNDTGLRFISGDWWVDAKEDANQITVAGFPVAVVGSPRIRKRGAQKPSSSSNRDQSPTNASSADRTYSLTLPLSYTFANGTSAWSCEGGFSALGEISEQNGVPQPEFKRHQVEDISIDVDVSSYMHLDGEIHFYHGDDNYGHGFRGTAVASLKRGLISHVDGIFQAGNVKAKGVANDRLRYWFFDTRTLFKDPYPITQSIGWYGLGGGAWYHMSRTGKDPKFPVTSGELHKTSIGTSMSGYTYLPDADASLGLKMMGTFAPMPEAGANRFNCDVDVIAQFNRHGGMSTLSLNGQGYLLAPIDKREKYVAKLKLRIDYDLDDQIIDGRLQLITPPPEPRQSGGGIFGRAVQNLTRTPRLESNNPTARLKIDIPEKKWFFKLGSPPKRAEVRLDPFGRIKAYFLVGNDLGSGRSDGLYAGLKLEWTISRCIPYSYLEMCAGLDFAAFCDAELLHYKGMQCGGYKPVGFYGWYMNGSLKSSVTPWLKVEWDGFDTGIRIPCPKICYAYGIPYPCGVTTCAVEIPGGSKRLSLGRLERTFSFGGPKPLWAATHINIDCTVIPHIKIKQGLNLTLGNRCNPK
ncbi:hypothetical protein KQI65_09785 [bacterium]|nr:hypothetical protein [bacterium]